MILQHVSWQELLIVVLVFSIAWYIAVLLLFYRRDLLAFFHFKMKVSSVPSHRSAEVGKTLQRSLQKKYTAGDELPEVMGKSRLPEGMNIISADLIRFSDQIMAENTG
ncbi:hypothetical protein [Pedobacter antarcticus]|uniref:hypothetical protein n=1 Tax=Pedobacter antarcticus TaxID=34086 RepID=UPI00292E31B3|nr:hypothetical protein [Pedobacter antarcticus]